MLQDLEASLNSIGANVILSFLMFFGNSSDYSSLILDKVIPYTGSMSAVGIRLFWIASLKRWADRIIYESRSDFLFG